MNAVCKFLKSGLNFILYELYINQKLTQACEFHILILYGRSPISNIFILLNLMLNYCIVLLFVRLMDETYIF